MTRLATLRPGRHSRPERRTELSGQSTVTPVLTPVGTVSHGRTRTLGAQRGRIWTRGDRRRNRANALGRFRKPLAGSSNLPVGSISEINVRSSGVARDRQRSSRKWSTKWSNDNFRLWAKEPCGDPGSWSSLSKSYD